MVSPQKIKYCGLDINVDLNPLEVILDVAFDSDNGATPSHLNRSAVTSESHDGRYKNTYRYKYDELFSPQFTIVKADFSDFTQSEVRQVLKYLTQTDKPALLEVYYDKNSAAADFCAIGGWTSIETYKLANNRTVGIAATFEAITPHAMSDLETIPITATDNYKKTITVDTDDNQPVYPRITIKENSTSSIVKIDHAMTDNDVWLDGTVYHYEKGGMYYWLDAKGVKHDSNTNTSGITTTSVMIKNTHTSDDKTVTVFDTFVKNNDKGEIIIVDGANKVISSSATKRIFGSDFDWTWLPLYDGENTITVVGNCDVTVEFREVRKVGEY